MFLTRWGREAFLLLLIISFVLPASVFAQSQTATGPIPISLPPHTQFVSAQEMMTLLKSPLERQKRGLILQSVQRVDLAVVNEAEKRARTVGAPVLKTPFDEGERSFNVPCCMGNLSLLIAAVVGTVLVVSLFVYIGKYIAHTVMNNEQFSRGMRASLTSTLMTARGDRVYWGLMNGVKLSSIMDNSYMQIGLGLELGAFLLGRKGSSNTNGVYPYGFIVASFQLPFYRHRRAISHVGLQVLTGLTQTPGIRLLNYLRFSLGVTFADILYFEGHAGPLFVNRSGRPLFFKVPGETHFAMGLELGMEF